MKAIYQKPAIKSMAADTSELLAASLLHDNDGTIYEDLGSAPETTETSGNLSRKSLWEDDEYDY